MSHVTPGACIIWGFFNLGLYSKNIPGSVTSKMLGPIAVAVVLAGAEVARNAYGAPADSKYLGFVASAVLFGLSLLIPVKRQQRSEPGGYVKELFIHPIKSLRGISVAECEVDENGFKHDRKYMLAEPDDSKKTNPNQDPSQYRAVTQRQIPQLTLIETEIDQEKGLIKLFYPPQNISLDLPLALDDGFFSSNPRSFNTYIWGQTPSSYDLSSCYPEIPKFFDKVTGVNDSRITIVAPKIRRGVTRSVDAKEVAARGLSPETSFQDYYPGNLITEQSLLDLREKVIDKTNGDVAITARNFRPNMVIAGTAGAWDEDDWKKVQVSNHDFLVPCRNVRCQVTTVNTSKGIFEASNEPFRTMQTFRRVDPGAKYNPCFGMNLLNLDHGYKIRVGDELRVLERGHHHYISIF